VKIKAIILTLTFVLTASVSFSEAVFKYDAKDKRDPFTPLIDKEGNLLPEYRPAATAVTLNLEGIVWSWEGDSYAIISGAVLRTGEMIGDYTVKKIERSSVILGRAGEDSMINLRGEEE
jgi:type II secretory pathway component PulC